MYDGMCVKNKNGEYKLMQKTNKTHNKQNQTNQKKMAIDVPFKHHLSVFELS